MACGMLANSDAKIFASLTGDKNSVNNI